MEKSPDAFRTISEVAELLETPPHVLRFWESRFSQIRPVKRAGGRRYYRPVDVALLIGIRHLLHDEGMTIRGVQKILREHGVRHVSGMADEAADQDGDQVDAVTVEPDAPERPAPARPRAPATAKIIALETALRKTPRPKPAASDSADDAPAPDSRPDAAPPTEAADLFAAMSETGSTPVDTSAPDDSAPLPKDAAFGTDDAGTPPPEAEEAPMHVWAEPPAAPSATMTTLPRAAPPRLEAETVPATIAQRLRATHAGDLAPSTRATLSVLRARARSLRDRLDAFPRAGA